MTNNDLHSIGQKTKDRAIRTLLKIWSWAQVLWKGSKFLLHMWHRSCYFSNHTKASDMKIVFDTSIRKSLFVILSFVYCTLSCLSFVYSPLYCLSFVYYPLHCLSFCIAHCIVCSFILCLLSIVLSVHCIVCPLYCLSIVLSVHCIVCPSLIYSFFYPPFSKWRRIKKMFTFQTWKK
jgi:hypothetical protein